MRLLTIIGFISVYEHWTCGLSHWMRSYMWKKGLLKDLDLVLVTVNIRELMENVKNTCDFLYNAYDQANTNKIGFYFCLYTACVKKDDHLDFFFIMDCLKF